MQDDTISLGDIAGIIRRNIFGFVFTVVLCVGFAVLLVTVLPKKYKSKAVLNIQSSYFRNPLVSDMVAEVTDPGELNAQRQSLLRMALTDEFLDSLAAEFDLYKHPYDRAYRVSEREGLLKKIEYFSLSPTSFQVGMTANGPRKVYEITRRILDQMTFTLIEQRYSKLIKARDAIQSQVQNLSKALRDVNSPNQAVTLQAELDKLNANIAALRQKYTESHPELFKLRQRAAELKGRLDQEPPRPAASDNPDDYASSAFIIPSARQPMQDIYNDLLRKLSNLNIVIQMEKDRENVSYLAVVEQPTIPSQAFFPNPIMFALYGLLGGMMLGAMNVAYNEIKRAQLLTPEHAAISLGVPLLGELPSLYEDQPLAIGYQSPLRLPFFRESGSSA